MANKTLFLIIVTVIINIISATEINYLKLLHCLRNSNEIKTIGNKLLTDSEQSITSLGLFLWTNYDKSKNEFKKCYRKSRDSFDYDPLCVIDCINKFQEDYDYTCLASCYY